MKHKKTLALVLSTLLLTTALAFPVSAMKAVGNVDVAYGTPTIDGTLTADEWKSAGTFTVDSSTAKAWAGAFPADFSAKVNVMWDETNLYVSGTIKDSAVSYSSEKTYNKDAIQFSFDLGQVFYETTETRAIFYSFGCYEDGTGMLSRQESKNNGVVNDGEQGLAVKTVKTADGWTYEAAIPFAMLQEDCKLKSGKNVEIAAGLKINTMVCYMSYDASGKLDCALGTTKSDESVAYDWGPKEHGITLILQAKPEEPAAPSAPVTFDAAILAALAAAASAGTAVLIKKRR